MTIQKITIGGVEKQSICYWSFEDHKQDNAYAEIMAFAIKNKTWKKNLVRDENGTLTTVQWVFRKSYKMFNGEDLFSEVFVFTLEKGITLKSLRRFRQLQKLVCM